MEELCIRCKGKGLCGKPCKILARFKENLPKIKLHFSGPSPPEIFVGRNGYPNVNIGILSPISYDTKHAKLNSAEEWAKNNLSIANILRLRGGLVHGKIHSNIKKPNLFSKVFNELALSHKSTGVEFYLKKKPLQNIFSASNVFSPMTNPALIKKVELEENIRVIPKVDYIVDDGEIKAVDAINELSRSIKIDHLQKLLSAGLLGMKRKRKMVPTRYSITAVDDIISKKMIEKIKDYKEIDRFELLCGDYLGNYIKILLLPGKFSFEAVEVWINEGSSKEDYKTTIAQDYEGFNGRKNYAFNITGAYYSMRLAVCEYLERVKRQANVFILREIGQEYYAPLGVGIVREATRRATNNVPLIFETKDEAINYLNKNKVFIQNNLGKSWILGNYKKQRSLGDFF
jgi:DNA repair protein NreA